MPNIPYCDRCGTPIKTGEIKWKEMIDKYIQPNPFDFYKALKEKNYENALPVEEYDRIICNECKELLDLFFKLRFESLIQVIEMMKRNCPDSNIEIKKKMLKLLENDKNQV